MNPTSTSFYVTGGTLRQDAPSYVERQADRELYEGLLQGEYCYVLHARQMGKSSLMVHTTARLRQEGVAVVNLDLTRLGQNLTVEQWYDGLLGHIGRQLDLEDELEECWLKSERLSPLQRWMEALEQVVLPAVGRRQTGDGSSPSPELIRTADDRLPSPVPKLVLFIDEIDAVRSLRFSTDEFFAAIRECYNRRTQEPEFGRLTFCLLGVATPSDLIQDTRTTPFNIGRRIELTDFTEAEAAPLAQGLVRTSPPTPPLAGEGSPVAPALARQDQRYPYPPSLAGKGDGGLGPAQALLERILYWTEGHPYLTQRLCQAVAADPTVTDVSGVDRHCEALFLSPLAQEKDDNLLFVRDRLLRNDRDVAGLLELYGRVWRGRRVAPDDTSQLVSLLRLSGITRVESGWLRVRNRIYARVFDREWITAHMPDAELRRQRAAYRRGILRASAVAALVLAVVVSLAFAALHQARRADRQRRVADQQRRVAEAQRSEARRNLYAAQMNLAQQNWEEGNLARAQRLLEAWRPEPGQEDLRGFEWRYLWSLCQGDQRATLRGHTAFIPGLSFSPDGKLLASGSGDGTVKLWEQEPSDAWGSRRELVTLKGHKANVWQVKFSPDGRTLASVSNDGTVKLWDISSHQVVASLPAQKSWHNVVAFSPDGTLLATRSDDKTVKLWDLSTRREAGTLVGHQALVTGIAFAPDGRTVATGGWDRTVKLWDLTSRRVRATLKGHKDGIECLAFSPDGRMLASGGFDSMVKLWDLASNKEVATLSGHRQPVRSVAFSPDGKILASASEDNTVKLWDLPTRRERATLVGHQGSVWSVAFAPDGKSLASGGLDMTVRLWDPAVKRDRATVLQQGASSVGGIAFSPDGKTLAAAIGMGPVRLSDVASGRAIALFKGHRDVIRQVVFSPDGRILASGSDDGTVKLWDVIARRELVTFHGKTNSDSYFPIAFSPDGRMLAMAGQDKTVKLWDVATRRLLASLKGQTDVVWGVAFSPDGRTLAAGSIRGPVMLWDVATRREITPLQGSSSGISPLLFCPDGRTLITGTGAGTLKRWDLVTRQAAATLEGHAGAGGCAVLSPDGRTLAMSDANTITLSSLTVAQEVATLKGHLGPIWSLAFSPDGNTLASASSDGAVRLWLAPPFTETDPLMVSASSGDQRALLQWRPLSWALGYNVYRGSAHARPDQLVKLTDRPVGGATFTDRSPLLANGRSQTYAVVPLYRGAAGQLIEGRKVLLQVTPTALPPGYSGCSINEERETGSAAFDAPAAEITLRGSGHDIWGTADGCYFMGQPVTADFTVTTTLLTRPAAARGAAIDPWAQAGLMLRESLEPGARQMMLAVTAAHGLQTKWRPVTGASTETGAADIIPAARLKLPITLRLTRRGNTVSAEYSLDNGRSFQPAGDVYQFQPPLARAIYVGLAITAHDASQVVEAKFRGLEIRKQ